MEQMPSTEKVLKVIEIPKEEIESLSAINNFLDKISEDEYEYFDGPIGYEEGINEKIKFLLEKNLREIKKDTSLSEKEIISLGIQARHEAEYEACKEIVDYQKKQLEKLIKFVEDQKIWKSKFTTASNINFYHWRENPIEDFKKLLNESEELHKTGSFAGQNLNSIYFVPNSGLPLRIKTAELFGNGNIREALQYSNELILYIDDITDEDFKEKSFENTTEIQSKFVSFEPKFAYRVEEFITREFKNHKTGNYRSKIKVLEESNKVIIKGYDGAHGGHYINKIYF